MLYFCSVFTFLACFPHGHLYGVFFLENLTTEVTVPRVYITAGAVLHCYEQLSID